MLLAAVIAAKLVNPGQQWKREVGEWFVLSGIRITVICWGKIDAILVLCREISSLSFWVENTNWYEGLLAMEKCHSRV